MIYRLVEKTTQHHIWRCSHCRALAVTAGEKPPAKCGKCRL